MRAFAGATGLLMAAWVLVWTRRPSQAAIVTVVLRPQHYLQAIAHASIFVYWGLYWDPILDAVPLIAAQIVFAYRPPSSPHPATHPLRQLLESRSDA